MSDILFEDLCTAYSNAFKQVEDYIVEYCRLFEEIKEGLVDYLQCPENRIKWVDRLREETSLSEAIYLMEQTCFLQMKIDLNREGGAKWTRVLSSGLNYPSQTVYFTLSVRGTTNSFKIKLENSFDEFSVNKETKEENIKVFYDFIYHKIIEHYQQMFRYIVEHGEVFNELR